MAIVQKVKPGMWRMKSGEEIAIVDMEETHLFNAMAMLQRKCAAMEAEITEHEDWEDGHKAYQRQSIQRFQAAIGMLNKEYQRRGGLKKHIEVIANMIRIEMEGPPIHARIL